MERIKKDGTPAKKPGPKAKKPTIKLDGQLRIETPEAKKVEVVETPEKPKKVAPLQFDGYTVRCIEGKYGKFYWDYEYNRLDWTSPEGEEVSLSPEGWYTFCTEIMPKVMAILGVPKNE